MSAHAHGSSFMQVRFRNPIKYKQDKEMFIAPEGLYSGQVRLFDIEAVTRLLSFGVHCHC